MATRAHDDAARLARRNSILQAARSLFLLDPHQLPSAAHIANEAGLAKGTVYLYFRTKEEIFLALLGEEFFGLMLEIESIFSDTSNLSIPSFLQRYAAYLEAHPEFLRLDAMTYSVLEQNMSHEVLREFKLALVAQLTKTGAQLDAALQFPAGRGVSLLLRTHAITRGLWQSLAYPPALRTLLVDEVFAPIRPNFNTELMATLGEYWRGALQNSAP
jgi:AcrR family transcriptional regulator